MPSWVLVGTVVALSGAGSKSPPGVVQGVVPLRVVQVALAFQSCASWYASTVWGRFCAGAAPQLLRYREAIEEGRTPGHFPVSLGLTLGTMGWTRSDTVAAFLYHSVVGYLSAALKPSIRVSVAQAGNRDSYKELLTEILRGSGIRYNAVVDRLVQTTGPEEFASLVQKRDVARLVDKAGLDQDRAQRVIEYLRGKESLFDIEMVDVITSNDIVIKKEGGEFTMTADYEDVVPLAGNVSFLVSFNKSVVVNAR